MDKDRILTAARSHIVHVRDGIPPYIAKMEQLSSKTDAEISKSRREDQVIQWKIKDQIKQKITELRELSSSPYFIKCEVRETGAIDSYAMWFAKFEYSEEFIYSWLAPVSSIRFENPGHVEYLLPSGAHKKLELLSKEQYMIVDGKILFCSFESQTQPRMLVHQEHFSNRKNTFVLPEIVAQMEKAQDQVIRLPYKGGIIISGPAGSGKTTLAFHRLAYLMRSPETSAFFPNDKVTIIVQDTGTRDYFTHLLPELGIHNVEISSFAQWAFRILGIEEYSYIARYGRIDMEQDEYEYQKLQALRAGKENKFSTATSTFLKKAYRDISETSQALLKGQLSQKVLDRFDITLLLQSYCANKKVIKSRLRKREVSFAAAIIDEFQNYLPEQLDIFQLFLDKDIDSMIYVGDVAQQIRIGTTTTWDKFDAQIHASRRVVLNKVYRNTKHILQYIETLGYKVTIPDSLREGAEVIEKIDFTTEQQFEYVKSVVRNNPNVTIGILAKEATDLEQYHKEFGSYQNVHVSTMINAQGVEFDTVCIVGVHTQMCDVEHVPTSHVTEKKKIEKDIMYIALTRAMNYMHILGTSSLKEVLSKVI